MSNVIEIETALRELPPQDQWRILRWLLDELTDKSQNQPDSGSAPSTAALPDYAARRRKIFGEKVLPNMVLTVRGEERW